MRKGEQLAVLDTARGFVTEGVKGYKGVTGLYIDDRIYEANL